jgi:DNA-binding NtrC family response regulator/tetratricopeptide (TPR) repeat protein
VATALPGASLPDETAAEIARWAEGNPLLIREVLLAGLEGGRFVPAAEGWRTVPSTADEPFPPAGVQTERRFGCLSVEEKEALAALALHRGFLSLGSLSRFLRVPDPPAPFPLFRQLVRKGWAREGRNRRSFALFHERLRRPLLRELGRERRKEGHGRLAEDLAPAAKEDPALVPRVAEHWARAGNPEETAHWCLQAGIQETERQRLRRGMLFLRVARRAMIRIGGDILALESIELPLARSLTKMGKPRRSEEITRRLSALDLPLFQKGECLFVLGCSIGYQGHYEEALTELEASRRVFEELGDSQYLVRVLSARAVILNSLGRYEEVLTLSKRLKEMIRDNPTLERGNLITLAGALHAAGRLDEAFRTTCMALKVVRRPTNTSVFAAHVYTSFGQVRYMQGKARKSLRWFLAAKRSFDRIDYPFGQALASSMVGIQAFRMGMPAKAYEETRRALEEITRIGNLRIIVQTANYLIEIAAGAGRYGLCLEKMEFIKKLLSREGAPPRLRLASLHDLVRVDFALQAGMPEKAREILDRFSAEDPKLALLSTLVVKLARARVLLKCGDASGAMALVREVENEEGAPPVLSPRVLEHKARCLASLGRAQESREMVAKALEAARNLEMGGAVPGLKLLDARFALAAIDADRAISAAKEAREEGIRTGRRFVLWRAWNVEGLALEQKGLMRRAAKSFRRAAWALEAEITAFPEPYRGRFQATEEAEALIRRSPSLRLEETALRLACLQGQKGSAGGEFWGNTALAWAVACRGILGADAMVIRADWKGAVPAEVVFGEGRASDETWHFPFGGKGMRSGRVMLFRRWERGPFLPVSKRMARILAVHLSAELEREEQRAMARRFDRVERSLRGQMEKVETTLLTTRRTLARTQTALGKAKGYGEIVGTSKAMKKVYRLIRRWAPTDAVVLVVGESGTGKELVARAIHGESKRTDGPLFAVNCAAVADSLLEDELFGHEKGAFTGADETRPGLFELTSGGTLVLDEVSDMSLKMQAQLLRVLEEKKVRRLGGTEGFAVDMRVIALTNRSLEEGVEAGWFREDLFHRLNVAAVRLPPLRSRKEDIPLLAEYFLSRLSPEAQRKKISREASAVLMRHRWPGNVRELRNQIHRASMLARESVLQPGDFPDLGTRVVTKTSLSAGLLARLRKVATKEGFPLETRHEDLFHALAAGGSLRRKEYEQMAGISTATAVRDLKRFLSLGLIRKIGKNRATVYVLGPLITDNPVADEQHMNINRGKTPPPRFP